MNVCIKKYKGHYSGRCFIVGNGPSLANTNLDLIKDEISFGMNRIPLIYNKTKWRPTYYIYCSTNVNTVEWGTAWTKSVNDAVNEKKTTCFIWEKFKHLVKEGQNVEWLS